MKKYLLNLKKYWWAIEGRYYRKYRSRSIRRMDRFRASYDALTFKRLGKLADKWLHQYPEQAHYHLSPVKYWLENMADQPTYVLEIGGWRGDLARSVLEEYDFIECWHNYDVISDKSRQKCHHPRYQMIPLDDYIWNLDLGRAYNALIATHVIEHLKWRELVPLIHWIPSSISTVLLEAPIPESSEDKDWTGDHSTHILEKGWRQVIAEMKKVHFEKRFQNKETVVFSRS